MELFRSFFLLVSDIVMGSFLVISHTKMSSLIIFSLQPWIGVLWKKALMFISFVLILSGISVLQDLLEWQPLFGSIQFIATKLKKEKINLVTHLNFVFGFKK